MMSVLVHNRMVKMVITLKRIRMKITRRKEARRKKARRRKTRRSKGKAPVTINPK